MDRIKKSLRESFRRKKGQHTHEASKPVEWQADELAVRSGTCNFQVKYLGCTEVFESRGMQVCEEAFKVLKRYKRKPMRAVLHVSGEALRVVDKDSKTVRKSIPTFALLKISTTSIQVIDVATQGLIVDQTIEKVSFCAPDRNYDRGFSYICRDGATRRWMCHGFLAVKFSKMSLFKKHDVVKGERLSHAVGCAFAACLERKQARDKECGVAIKFDGNNQTSFTRFGSFKTGTLTDKLVDGQENVRPNLSEISIVDKPRELPITARERPTVKLDLLRQASFRGPQLTSKSFSPFKKQLSLRLMELPSTLQRREEYTSKDDYLSNDPSAVFRSGDKSSSSDAHKVATISAFVPNHALPLTNVISSGHEGVPNGYHPVTPHPNNVNGCQVAGATASGFLDFASSDGGDSIKRLCRQITQDFAPACSLAPSTSSSTLFNGLSNGDSYHALNGFKMDNLANGDATKITNPFLESHNILPGLGMMNGPAHAYPYNYHLSYRGHLLGYTGDNSSTNANPSTPIRLDGRTAMVHPYLKSPSVSQQSPNNCSSSQAPLSRGDSNPGPRTSTDFTNKTHEALTKRNTNPFLNSIAQHPNLSYL